MESHKKKKKSAGAPQSVAKRPFYLCDDILLHIARYYCRGFKDVVQLSHRINPFRSFLFDSAKREGESGVAGQTTNFLDAFMVGMTLSRGILAAPPESLFVITKNVQLCTYGTLSSWVADFLDWACKMGLRPKTMHLNNLDGDGIEFSRSKEFLGGVSSLSLTGLYLARGIIETMPNLRTLSLHPVKAREDVLDDTVVEHLTNLESLTIRNCQKLRFFTCHMLQSLKRLDVEACNSIEWDMLEYIPNLTELRVRDCKGFTTEAIKKFTKLRSLELDILCEAEEHYVSLLTGLESLRVFGCCSDYLVRNLTSLKSLWLHTRKHTDSVRLTNEGLVNLKELERLTIFSSSVTMEGLCRLTKLKSLALWMCNSFEVTEKLKNLKNLRSLEVKYCDKDVLTSDEITEYLCDDIKDTCVVYSSNDYQEDDNVSDRDYD